MRWKVTKDKRKIIEVKTKRVVIYFSDFAKACHPDVWERDQGLIAQAPAMLAMLQKVHEKIADNAGFDALGCEVERVLIQAEPHG